MDIKQIMPRQLFIRFVVTFLIILMFIQQPLKSLFLWALLEVVIFSILMVLFDVIMVQYLERKDQLNFFEAVVCRYSHLLVSFVSYLVIYQMTHSLLKLVLLWGLNEVAVGLAQWLFVPKRGKEHAR